MRFWREAVLSLSLLLLMISLFGGWRGSLPSFVKFIYYSFRIKKKKGHQVNLLNLERTCMTWTWFIFYPCNQLIGWRVGAISVEQDFLWLTTPRVNTPTRQDKSPDMQKTSQKTVIRPREEPLWVKTRMAKDTSESKMPMSKHIVGKCKKKNA